MKALEIKKRSKRKKITALSVTLIVVVLFFGIAAYAYSQKLGPFSESSYQNQPDRQLDSDNPAEPDGLAQEVPVTNNNKTPQEADQIDSTGKSSILEITSTQKLSDVVRVRALIQKVTQQGECTIEITSGSESYEASVGVQPTATSSTCKGFNIPVDSLPSGIWNIKITYTNNGEMSVANSELQV